VAEEPTLPTRCPACRSLSVRVLRVLRRDGQLAECTQCGHLLLLGCPPQTRHDVYEGVDEDSYVRSMESERRGSAEGIVSALARLGATGPLLDVGCSFGWLLEVAERAGLEAYGVDASESAAASSRSRGLKVRCGHFPEEDWGRRDWAVITYMDVLEHISDIESAMAETVARLRPGGFLGIQVPVSSGAVFLAADALDRISLGRVDGPLRRMLQIEFPYPHLHYFSRGSLEQLLRRFGLETVAVSCDPIATANLVDRVSWRKNASVAERVEATGLKLLLAAGKATGRNDLLRLIARRTA